MERFNNLNKQLYIYPLNCLTVINRSLHPLNAEFSKIQTLSIIPESSIFNKFNDANLLSLNQFIVHNK
jgi:hypothetical protein